MRVILYGIKAIPNGISMIPCGSKAIPCGMRVILYGMKAIPKGISVSPWPQINSFYNTIVTLRNRSLPKMQMALQKYAV
jgi:hypothetical protein